MALGALTWSIGLGSNLIGNLDGASKVKGHSWRAFAFTQNIGDIEGVLTELVIGGANELTAKFDCCEGVESIEYKPRRLGLIRPVNC